MALSNPFRVCSRGWGTLVHQNHAIDEENGSIMVVMFVSLCFASKTDIFSPPQQDLASKLLRVPTLCKHLCMLHFAKAWKCSIVAQQITWHHDRNSNKSQLITLIYSFPFRRKKHRNCLAIRYFEKGVEFSNHIKTPQKSWSQWLRANGYFVHKTLSATFQPYYCLKTKSLSFLHVLLLFGVILVSLLTALPLLAHICASLQNELRYWFITFPNFVR